jgi:hypothetical protein
MHSPALVLFIAVMLAIAAATLVLLVLRWRRQRRARRVEVLPEEPSDLPSLVVQTDGEGSGPRHDDARGHGSDPAFAPRPAPEGAARPDAPDPSP